MSEHRFPPWLPVAVALAYGAGATWVLATFEEIRPIEVTLLVASAAYATGGLLVWWQRPDQRFGPLLLLIAVCMFFPTFQQTHVPLLWTFGTVFDSAFAPVLAYVVLRFPRERLVARIDRAIAVSVAFVAIVFPIGLTTLVDPRVTGCPTCPPDLNLLLVSSDPELLLELVRVLYGIIAVQATAVALRLAWKVRAASVPARRVLAPVAVPAALWFFLHAITRAIRLQFDVEITGYGPVVAASTGLLALVPFGVMVGLLRARARRSRVGDLVIELGRVPTTERVRDAIARTLGDPRAEVGFWVGELRRYVTAEGDPLDLPSPGDGREITYVEGRGAPVAAIVHDAALRDEPALIDAVGAVARFAVENERLHGEVVARLEEVRESRARIVQAGDAERKRIERNLHDGAQQRLIALSIQLRLLADAPDARELRPQLESAADGVAEALAELRELAQGLHPAILTDEGLGPAVEYLAERAPSPVEVHVDVERLPGPVEAAAYFVVAEALANVGKYASGASASVRVQRVDGRVEVEVVDDGPGGASMAAGSGLRGLADRVSAVRGRLEILSPEGGGTRVRAEIPCE